MKKLLTSYHFFAFATVACWAIGNALTRVAVRGFSPYAISFLRYLVAAVIFGGILAVKRPALPRSRDAFWFLLAGATGFGLYMILYNFGYLTVTAATGSVISATIPLMTAILAQLLFHERLNLGQWGAIGIQFFGILLIALGGGSVDIDPGIVWMLLSAVSLSVYNLIQRRLVRSYDSLTVSIYSVLCGFLMLCFFAPQAFRELKTAPPSCLWAVILTGVFASAFAYLFWAKAFSLAETASQVSNYMFFTPILTPILAFFIAGELPERSTVAGGAVILLGAWIFSRIKAREASRQQKVSLN